MVEVLAILTVAVLVVVASVRPLWLVYWSTGAAFLMLPPNILAGEKHLIGVGLLFCIATGVALLQRRDALPRSLAWLPVWYAASVAVMIFNGAPASGLVPDVLVLVAIVAAVCTAFGRQLLVKAFVGLCAMVGVSYVVTLVGWLVLGFDSLLLTEVSGGYGYEVPMHFPFTVTMSSVQVFDVTVPRLSGFGREPGWMALYATVAFFLFRHTGWKSRIVRASLVVSVLGTLSTAGFAVFVVGFAVTILVAHNRRTWMGRFFQRTFGLMLFVGASWIAVFAPVLGVAAKSDHNAVSLSERSLATEQGWAALLSEPFAGGSATSDIASVNLIASVAAYGVLFAVFVTLAVLIPYCGSAFWRMRRGRMTAPLIAIFGTLLVSQPANGSTFVFILVAIVVAAGAGIETLPTLPVASPKLSRNAYAPSRVNELTNNVSTSSI